MDLAGERLIPADLQRTWDALNDPDTLKACIAGCETLERTGDHSFRSVMAVKVGPVSARFNGKLDLTDVQPPRAYTMSFEGQGGAAGFGRGTSRVTLEPEGDSTRLRYTASAQVGGKMAQIGSRLVDAAARKMTEDFFTAFEERLRSTAPAGTAVVEAVVEAAPAAAAGAARTVWWIVAGIVIAAVLWFLLR
jgi:carbon monoxide dehydrogenase subunit G